jgi:hypothetical protein
MKMKEYELYVPLVSENGKRLPPKELQRVKKRLVAQFGGVTHFPQKTKGVWRFGQATFFDAIIIVRVLTKETKATHFFWRKLKAELQREWKQKHVLIIARNVDSV